MLGSSSLPCFLVEGKTEGEWDVNIRDFVRILYYDHEARKLAGANARSVTLLDDAIRDRLRDVLISVSGAPMPAESYSVLECGNQERSSGTPEDLAAEQGEDSWLEGVLDDFWDGLSWFLKRLLLILAIAVATAAVAGALIALGVPAIIPVVIAGVAVAGTVLVSVMRIPETENHLLMIESSRYLKNQVLMEYYAENQQHANRRGYEPHQRALKRWLLRRMQRIMATDFEEYNAIPYQRYSLTALMNLYDFAEDAQVKEAARLVLDRQLAKFAVSNSQGRRLAPFRRLMEKVEPVAAGRTGTVWPLSDYDFTSALAMQYFGDATHLAEGRAHRYAAMPMMYATVTGYRPDAVIFDIAQRRPEGIWFHEFGHAGVERYARGRGFLLAAGGEEADYANKIEAAGFSLPFGNDNDRGVAWPTSLMFDFWRRPDQVNPHDIGPRDRLPQFLRIIGRFHKYPDNDDKKMQSYGQNTYVLGPFAAGGDIRVPEDLGKCLEDGPVIGSHRWRFFSTASCNAYDLTRPVHVAIFSNALGPISKPRHAPRGWIHRGRRRRRYVACGLRRLQSRGPTKQCNVAGISCNRDLRDPGWSAN